MNGADVKTYEDLVTFWQERADSLETGEIEPVSDDEARAALRRTLNLITRKVNLNLNLENFEANRDDLQRGMGIQELDGKYRDQPAFIVAAGPSLDKNVEQLKRVAGRYPIFACDGALPILTQHGIEPDYAMVIDAKPVQAKFFDGIERGTRTKLLCIGCVSPAVIDAWPGEIRFFNTFGSDEEEHDQVHKYGRDFGFLSSGGNVSTSLYHLALDTLANPIVLVGHDYSYKVRYYADGGIDELAASHVKPARPTWDIYGDPVSTDLSLWSYRNYTDEMATLVNRHCGVVTINATEGGILGTTSRWVRAGEPELMDCFDYLTLSEAIDLIDGGARVCCEVPAPAEAVPAGV